LDADNDGLMNDEDTTPISGFTLNKVPYDSDNQKAVIEWQCIAGVEYQVEYRDSLENSWAPLVTIVPAENGPFVYQTHLPQAVNRFYRVRYEKQ